MTKTEWHKVKLGEICSFKYGQMPKKEELTEEGYPVFSGYRVVGHSLKYHYRDPEIVVVARGVGGTGDIKMSPPFCFLTNLSIAALIASPDVHKPFLFYRLAATKLWDLRTGSAQAQITIERLREYEVRIPPLPVQRRIAGILSAYDDLIENNQRRIKILEEMARSLYREWFVHFRFPGHEKVQMVPSPLGSIPQGWEVKPLGELATVTMGLSPKGDTYNEEGNGTPLVNGPVEFGDRFTKRMKWTTDPSKFCKEGDLVVCVRGSTTGKYVKSDGMYCLGRGVCGISSKYQCFVELLFESELPTLLGQTSGSTFPSWTGPQLKSHRVLSPPVEVIERFDALVTSMSAAVLRYSRQIQNLRRTRDLLLPRLLSGEVGISKTN